MLMTDVVRDTACSLSSFVASLELGQGLGAGGAGLGGLGLLTRAALAGGGGSGGALGAANASSAGRLLAFAVLMLVESLFGPGATLRRRCMPPPAGRAGGGTRVVIVGALESARAALGSLMGLVWGWAGVGSGGVGAGAGGDFWEGCSVPSGARRGLGAAVDAASGFWPRLCRIPRGAWVLGALVTARGPASAKGSTEALALKASFDIEIFIPGPRPRRRPGFALGGEAGLSVSIVRLVRAPGGAAQGTVEGRATTCRGAGHTMWCRCRSLAA